MLSATGIRAKAVKLTALLLTSVAILNASGVCADLFRVQTAPTHACCPKPNQAAPKSCAKLGCVTASPVMLAISPAVDNPWAAPMAANFFLMKSAGVRLLLGADSPPSQDDRFLIFHQLLI
jgi:hypothetical protein